MTQEEIARFEQVLKEAERVAAEVAMEAAFADDEGIPLSPVEEGPILLLFAA